MGGKAGLNGSDELNMQIAVVPGIVVVDAIIGSIQTKIAFSTNDCTQHVNSRNWENGEFLEKRATWSPEGCTTHQSHYLLLCFNNNMSTG